MMKRSILTIIVISFLICAAYVVGDVWYCYGIRCEGNTYLYEGYPILEADAISKSEVPITDIWARIKVWEDGDLIIDSGWIFKRNSKQANASEEYEYSGSPWFDAEGQHMFNIDDETFGPYYTYYSMRG